MFLHKISLYVLPYGQMSLWGILVLPQTYNLYWIIILILVVNLITEKISTKIKGEYRIGPHNKDIISIIYGSLLGDAHAEKRTKGVGTRISFHQEDSHIEYIYYLHNIMSKAGYCNSKLPIAKKRLGFKGKIRKVCRFHTWTYTSFNQIHNDWYQEGRKCVPNDIDKYITPLALAIWIMDDGSKIGKSIKFSTNSFTYLECQNLVIALGKNFELKASIQSAGTDNQYIIYIWKESMENLRRIVGPYIIPEMKYKII